MLSTATRSETDMTFPEVIHEAKRENMPDVNHSPGNSIV
jgi:hypothetical protein